MKYNPKSPEHRKALADKIINKLEDCGFSEDQTPHSERVFSRRVNDKILIRVYTSVSGNSVRVSGKDAVRICGVCTGKEGKIYPLVKEKRVNRTGDIESIVDRMYNRMRDAWKVSASRPSCKNCGAPTFVSKKGNDVCVDICWKESSS